MAASRTCGSRRAGSWAATTATSRTRSRWGGSSRRSFSPAPPARHPPPRPAGSRPPPTCPQVPGGRRPASPGGGPIRLGSTGAGGGRWRGEMAGTLDVGATPLGSLDDLSPRGAATRKQAAAVAAEDTRHTKTLLAHVGSRAELVSFHAHSPESALRRILHLLGTGKDVALVTDAGTPTGSDPGAGVVASARARDVPVVTIPGPTAVAAALAVSGLSADRYVFLGFL